MVGCNLGGETSGKQKFLAFLFLKDISKITELNGSGTEHAMATCRGPEPTSGNLRPTTND